MKVLTGEEKKWLKFVRDSCKKKDYQKGRKPVTSIKYGQGQEK